MFSGDCAIKMQYKKTTKTIYIYNLKTHFLILYRLKRDHNGNYKVLRTEQFYKYYMSNKPCELL